MQPGLGVTNNPNPSGEAMGMLMYFAATFEGFSLLNSECVAFFTIQDSSFSFIMPFKCACNLQRDIVRADQLEEIRSFILAGF